jgi:hypothetical protein
MQLCQFANGSLELRKIELVPIHIEKKPVLILDTPRRANTEIGKLSILVRSIPALDYLIENAQASRWDRKT